VRGFPSRPSTSVLVALALAPVLAFGTVSTPAKAQDPLPPRAFAYATPAAAQLVLPAATKMKYAAPTGLRAKASARGADVVALNWSFKTPGLHYQVQYATAANFVGGKAIIVKVASTAIGGLPTGARYYFRVRIVNSANKAISGWSKAVTTGAQAPADPGARPLQVASFNIRNWKRTGGGKWSVRGPLVAATILSRRLDVVGLQEADFNKVGGINQIDSLLRMLNAKGAAYRVVVSGSAATAGTRIIYNSATVTPVWAGMRQLSTLAGDVKRYVVWAHFVQSSTERKFFFATTHLVSNPKSVKTKKCSGSQTKYYKMRKVQAGQVVAEIKARNTDGLPVILTGDMNSHKVHCPNNAPYRIYAAAGLVDPLGNPDFSKTPVNPTAEVRIHSEWDTSNHYARKPVRHNIINGHHVDYVWVSKSIKTLEYEVVVKINDSTLKYVGTHPSDHNMVRASVLIP